MARAAEVVTIKSLTALVELAKSEFAKAKQAQVIAESVKEVPDAFKVLNESVTTHDQEGLKALRKVVVKITSALDTATVSSAEATKLIAFAASLKLFDAE